MTDSIMRWLQATDINEALLAIPEIERSDAKVLSGKSSPVFKTANEVYRFATSRWTAEQFLKEKSVLDELKGQAPFFTPIVTHFSTEPVYIAQELLPGIQANSAWFSRQDPDCKDRLIKCMAYFLAWLHDLDSSRFNIADTKHGEAIADRFDVYIDAFSQLEHGKELASFASDTFRMLAVLNTSDIQPSLLHGNFVLQNCLVEESTASLLSVVDFTVCWIGDYHWDFTVLRGGVGDRYFAKILEVYSRITRKIPNISLIMALERTQLCHFLYWIKGGAVQDAIVSDIRNWSPLDTANT
ncbi:phosphotransferase family protein [Cyanobium sp. LEGE 06113]|uniref:phosphotransferase family protein n=1 Tax=Cyanobium sp. LEGE 06113 TaxID=1297573 RepID=UPI00187DFED2|nr:aminoglycoside phosphotransferase family protein [Cyanobium sp. LEGE 06113]MBE9155228.1 aminoglycoside phosphotransferase family protein [Cyanobium sp. LEGE 06113]